MKTLTVKQTVEANKDTPWGHAQSQKTVAAGIVRYETASHGGYELSHARLAEMPADLRAFKPWAGEGWYEEDCDWAVICLAFPQHFDEVNFHFAVKTLQGYHPELVTPERHAKADAWLAKNTDKYTIGSLACGEGIEGWLVSAHSLVAPENRLTAKLDHYPTLPKVFTLEQFKAA
jgi:hypothetical protein